MLIIYTYAILGHHYGYMQHLTSLQRPKQLKNVLCNLSITRRRWFGSLWGSLPMSDYIFEALIRCFCMVLSTPVLTRCQLHLHLLDQGRPQPNTQGGSFPNKVELHVLYGVFFGAWFFGAWFFGAWFSLALRFAAGANKESIFWQDSAACFLFRRRCSGRPMMGSYNQQTQTGSWNKNRRPKSWNRRQKTKKRGEGGESTTNSK